MFYFSTRQKARNWLKARKGGSPNNSSWKVVDCKDKLSVNGHRWAVKVL